MKKLTQRTLWLGGMDAAVTNDWSLPSLPASSKLQLSKSAWKLILIITIIGLVVSACDDGTTTTPDPCANGHAFPEWIAPTCTVEGNSERVCTRSGCTAADTRTTGFAKLDHEWEYDADATPPTCTTVGRGHRHCKYCPADEEGGTYAMLPHKGEWDEIEPPNCVFAGVKFRVCEDCGTEETEEVGIAEDEHDIGGNNPPTCLLPGSGTIFCKRDNCDYTVTGNTINPRGHNFVEHWEAVTAADCTAAGLEERFCTHDFCDKIADPNNAENHYRQTRPIAALGHTGTIAAFAATCTTAGNSALSGNCVRFDQCEYVVTGTVVNALDHDWNNWTLDNANITALTGIGVTRTCSKATEASCTETASVTLAQYIADYAAQAGTAADPVPLKVSINLGTMETDSNGWTQLLAALNSGGKLVNLDLSDSTMTTAANSFNTGVSLDMVESVPILPDGIDRIASITLPNTAESIGNMAFMYCTNLTSVTIGNSVQTIGNQAFLNCTNLTSVTIGNSVQTIGDMAFLSCTNLTSVIIPNSVTSIGDFAFVNCIALTSVTFQRADTTIGNDYDFPYGASLRTAYAAGGIGTYTRPDSASWDWTKQN